MKELVIDGESLSLESVWEWAHSNSARLRLSDKARRKIQEWSASHIRVEDSTSVSSTACRSNVDRLMTFSTSDVAVLL